jgi:hypothetical protein
MSYTHRDGPADRFQAAMDAVADAKRYVATLRDELQECFDNVEAHGIGITGVAIERQKEE